MSVGLLSEEKVVGFMNRRAIFGRIKRLYFVGIGGAGMSGIAEILYNLGYEISGSDTTPSEVTEYLGRIGVRVDESHDGENITGFDVVIISSAVGEDNPEVIAARKQGLPVIKRAEMLGELMRLKFSIGVAGTHGKTTTTSMIGRILQTADLKPTLIVGGVVSELGTGASLGEGDYLVAEVDEYDRSIYNTFPSLAVLTNIELDHLDCYDDLDDLKSAFLSYVNRVPFFGAAVISADDKESISLRDRITRPFVTFGFSEKADYRALNIRREHNRTVFSVEHNGVPLGDISLRVAGRHNVANAMAAVAAASELEIDFDVIVNGLSGFNGVSRRFETIGTVNGITVIDDYAHHPTEVYATLTTARELYDGRLLAVFQPHLYSRTQEHLSAFARELAAADLCVLTDIYPAREEPIPGLTSDSIRKEAEKLNVGCFSYVGVKENAIEVITKDAKAGDVILIIGAGSITHIGKAVLERLGRK